MVRGEAPWGGGIFRGEGRGEGASWKRWRDGGLGGGGLREAESLLDLADLTQRVGAPRLGLFGRRGRRRRRRRGLGFGRRPEADAGDVEVFLEAVGLEEIGEFEGADVAALLPDFPLEVGDHPAQVLEAEAGAQQLEPLALAVVTQTQGLAGETAIELVGGEDVVGTDGGRHKRVRPGVPPSGDESGPARRGPIGAHR